MIDYLSASSKNLLWLKPLLLLTTGAAFIVFGYVMLFVDGTEKDIYLIPCIVSVLWSLICWLILSFFPNVPSRVSKQQRFTVRIKNTIVRGIYYLILLVFFILSVLVLVLTFKLLNVWRIEFYT